MIRLIKELFNPSLKCERVGHDLKERQYKISRKAEYWRNAVLEQLIETESYCKRCHVALFSNPELEYWRSVQSVSANESWWLKLKRQGYIKERLYD